MVHTLCTFFFYLFAPYKLPPLFTTIAPPKSRFQQLITCSSIFLFIISLSARTMEAKMMERKRTSVEKTRKDSVVEEVEDEIEEEDESGAGDGGLAEEEKKKGAAGGSGRRGSSGGGGVSQPSCQAERCGADLTDAKKYHRRHKVCEFHSKAPVVVVAGLRQRFCQQCSRFHDLAEFDEVKRSCRRRLAGHNERRRKSNVETCNEGSSRGKGQPPKDSLCRNVDDRGRLQMNMAGSSGCKSFHIR